MGCFLLITKKDFAQLSASLRQAISLVPGGDSAHVQVQVDSTVYASAREMAEAIRQQVPGARVIPDSGGEAAVPTYERQVHTILALSEEDPSLGALYRSALNNQLKSQLGSLYFSTGKAGEQVAAQVLEQHQHLTIRQIATAQGVDIRACAKRLKTNSRFGGRRTRKTVASVQ